MGFLQLRTMQTEREKQIERKLQYVVVKHLNRCDRNKLYLEKHVLLDEQRSSVCLMYREKYGTINKLFMNPPTCHPPVARVGVWVYVWEYQIGHMVGALS